MDREQKTAGRLTARKRPVRRRKDAESECVVVDNPVSLEELAKYRGGISANEFFVDTAVREYPTLIDVTPRSVEEAILNFACSCGSETGPIGLMRV